MPEFMIQLPVKERKPQNPAYHKPKAVKELERLAMDEARRLHPTCPALAPRTFRDDSANGLTACIVKYIALKGGFASRISNQGTFNSKLGKYIPSTTKKGLADIMATFRGISLSIEVKHGKDHQSDAQRQIESEIKRAGGQYFVARDFTSFKQWFDSL